jgi:crotonobetainyl-CoA:carnitine CoA-transferase CaiB-like acyl-CoA transferase
MPDRPPSPERSGGPLTSLRVLELGMGVAVPFAGKLLADLGASVTKLEWPQADPARTAGPFPLGRDGESDYSGLFIYLNDGKAFLPPPSQPPGEFASTLHEMAGDYDVVLLDDHLGGPLAQVVGEMQRRHPRLVAATVTPYGLDGPYAAFRAYDSTCGAAGGLNYGVGEESRPPLPLPMSQCSYQAGLCCAIAVLLALIARARDGLGQHVDLSVHEIIASLHCGYFLPRYLFSGGVVGSRSGRVGGTQPYPNTVLRCADGLVLLSAPQLGQWLRFLDLMGQPEWSTLPRYRDRRAMQHAYKDEADALIQPWLEQHTKEQLLELFLAHRIPFAPVLTGEDICQNPHLLARHSIKEQQFPDGTSFLVPAVPLRFSYCESDDLSPSVALDARLRAAGHGNAAPLRGLTVLDLGTAWAGGIAGRILGDFGADVIKVESWSHMDGSRMGRPIVVDDTAGGDSGQWPDLQPGFHVHGRNKRSVTLNLKAQAGRELLYQLAAQADLIIHNYPPDTAARMGLADTDLRPYNPDLVLVAQSVAGAQGPCSGLIGYAGTVAALSGLANAVGYPGEEPIAMMEGLYCDVVSALTSALAALAGVIGVLTGTTGGCQADVAQWEATLALCAEAVMEWSIRGQERASEGYTSPVLAPQGAYLSSAANAEEQWVCLAVGSDAEWRDLVSLLGERFEPGRQCIGWSLPTRREHAAEIDESIGRWMRAVGTDSAIVSLRSHGLAASRVCSIENVFVDPQLRHRNAFVDVEHPLAGIEPMPGIPWKLQRTPGRIWRSAPLLGEHTGEILRSRLHLVDEEIERLVAAGAIERGPGSDQRQVQYDEKGQVR